MSRTLVNLVVDLSAAISFLVLLATSFVIGFVLPPGTNKSLTLFDLTRHQWGRIHGWLGVALLGSCLLHLVLHWRWIVSVVRRRFGLATPTNQQLVVSGIVSVAVVSGLFALTVWLTLSQVTSIDSASLKDHFSNNEERNQVASELSPNPAAANSHRIDFWSEIYPVLESSCLSCHGPNKKMGGFRVDRREQFFDRDGRAPLVVPQKSDESPLIAIISGMRPDLPAPRQHRLPEHSVAVFRAWINEGAEWPDRRKAERNK